MKIYTNTFDLRQPTEKKFWVAPYSDFKIGIRVLGYNGTDIPYPPKNIELYKDGTKLTVDSTDGNMVYWKIKSEDTGDITYTVKAKRNNKVVGELKLIQSVTDSTVYEQESGGEIPSDLEVDSIEVGNEITFTQSPNHMITSNGCAYLYNVDSVVASIGNLDANNVTVNDKLTIPDANFSVGYINGCAMITFGAVTIDGCAGEGNFNAIRIANTTIDNNYIQMQQNGYVIRIQPATNISTSDTLVFKPYFMQELNDGCGGYVLASI